jgi:hypothetical protein
MSEAAQEQHLHSTELELPLGCSLQLEQHRLERLLFWLALSLQVQVLLLLLPLTQETCRVNDE